MYVVEQTNTEPGKEEWYVCTRTDDGTTITLTRAIGPYHNRQAAHQMAKRKNTKLAHLRAKTEQASTIAK